MELEEATCILYGRPQYKSIEQARFQKFNEVFWLQLTKDGKLTVKGRDEARIPYQESCEKFFFPKVGFVRYF